MSTDESGNASHTFDGRVTETIRLLVEAADRDLVEEFGPDLHFEGHEDGSATFESGLDTFRVEVGWDRRLKVTEVEYEDDGDEELDVCGYALIEEDHEMIRVETPAGDAVFVRETGVWVWADTHDRITSPHRLDALEIFEG